HDKVLTLSHYLAFGFDDRSQKLQILHVSAMCLDAVDKVLHHSLADIAAQADVVAVDGTHRFRLEQLSRNRRIKQVSVWPEVMVPLIPGFMNRSRCLPSMLWLRWFDRQKCCKNSCAIIISAFIRMSFAS